MNSALVGFAGFRFGVALAKVGRIGRGDRGAGPDARAAGTGGAGTRACGAAETPTYNLWRGYVRPA